MKRILRRCLLPILLAITCRAAEPPASLANLIYYESGQTIARTTYRIGIVLQADGTARGLFFASTRPGSSGPFLTSGTTTGTWRYVKAADGSMELEIIAPGGGQPFAGRRTLTFRTVDAGQPNHVDAPWIFGQTFHLAPISAQPPLINCSNRSFVPAGGKAFTGFVVTGDRPRTVLVRAIGPGLEQFGISDALADPQLALSDRTRVVAENDHWQTPGETSIQATGAFVGAFPLATGSRDAALVMTVAPGNYVAEVSGATAADSGHVLLEVYMLP